jgi:hypothetical protein
MYPQGPQPLYCGNHAKSAAAATRNSGGADGGGGGGKGNAN